MKRYINIMLSAAAALTLTSCVEESPFLPDDNGMGYGRVLTSSLAVHLQEAETRAEGDDDNNPLDVNIGEFIVEFYKVTDEETVINIAEEEPVYMFTYKKMPEIVTLPAGVSYRVVAYFGANGEAAWNSPYYEGQSEMFSVEPDQIVDSLEPIVCKLSNVMVSVNFDESLKAVMSEDSEVSVKIGEHGNGLEFNKNSKGSGFFKYVEESHTLTATFDGTVNGERLVETKTYSDVAPGVHYNITFRLHTPNASGSGNLSADIEGEENKGFTIQAGVTLEDLTGDGLVNFNPETEIILGGDEIILPPSEGDDEPGNGEDPGNGDDPNTPDEPVAGSGPTVTPYMPEGAEGHLVDLNAVNDSNGLVCAFKIESTAENGFTQFEVDIISDGLTKQELTSFGLDSHLDLVNPGSLATGLSGLGFPINVGGSKGENFDITTFMALLGSFKGLHTFKLTIGDANGTTVVNLQIKVS